MAGCAGVNDVRRVVAFCPADAQQFHGRLLLRVDHGGGGTMTRILDPRARWRRSMFLQTGLCLAAAALSRSDGLVVAFTWFAVC